MTGPASPAAASLDVAGMRACAERLLAQDAEELSSEEVEKLTLRLRGQVGLIVREIEQAALALPEDSVPRICALSCVGEARLRLSAQAGRTLHALTSHARGLARSARSLCDHYEDEEYRCRRGPERAAYLRLLMHCPGCRKCRAVDDTGRAVGVCATGDRLYEEYRLARRRSVLCRGEASGQSEV
ncbi:DUF6415 family natural product biosynthesis protein [Streptomyces sp. enrichment culture]|uniref:DUF6415 family natural product biosynthesis protein n=1 Tax=Streptomyces sp. enrichment culture TaxID=1795815 RepID=UPI003F576BE3